MKNLKKIILCLSVLNMSYNTYGQDGQSAYYQKAAKLYQEAASKTKCPERAKVLMEYAAWNDRMVKALATTGYNPGTQPTTPIPDCQGDKISTSSSSPTTPPTTYLDNQTNLDPNTIQSLAEGIVNLLTTEIEKNEDANEWFLISGGANFGVGNGVLSGTIADFEKPSGFNVNTSMLSRKGISFLFSFTDLKTNYFHSFQAFGTDGVSRHYIGRTKVNATLIDISLGKDMIGSQSKFHFVPSLGASTIFAVEDSFSSTNFNNIAYNEEWTNDFTFAIQGSVQTYYFISRRFAIQLGGKYNYFPKSQGDVYKITSFGLLNLGIAVKLL